MLFNTSHNTIMIGAFYLIAITLVSCSSQKEVFQTVDIVEANSKNEEAVMYFYENNWKAFREQAYQKKQIQGYQLMKSPVDSSGMFTLVLLTSYDSLQLAASEHNFQNIIKELRPEGPALLFNKPVREKIKIVKSLDTKTIARER